MLEAAPDDDGVTFHHHLTFKERTMNHLSTQNHFSIHGALMDPDYLRDARTMHPTQGKAAAVRHAALGLMFLLPALLWIASRIAAH
jgi:hypothetical protein